MAETWRQGTKSGHNIYIQTGDEPAKTDRQIGAMFDPADAATAVEAVNATRSVQAALDALDDMLDLAALSDEDLAALDAWANNIQLDIMRYQRQAGGRDG